MSQLVTLALHDATTTVFLGAVLVYGVSDVALLVSRLARFIVRELLDRIRGEVADWRRDIFRR